MTKVACWALLVLPAIAAEAVEVRLRSSAVAAGPIVRLTDVAEILGDDARLAQALAEIPLCPAPAAGGQRPLTQHEVRQLLTLSGLDLKTALVSGSSEVTISSQSSEQSSPLSKRPLSAAGVRQAVFEASIPGPAAKPPGPLPARPVVPPSNESNPAPLPLVERGATVTVQARAAGIRVTTSGKALDTGAAGATIGVELADVKQRVLARVVGPQVVEVTAAIAGQASSAASANTIPPATN